MKNNLIFFYFCHSLIPIIFGASIYILFRSTDLLVFKWFSNLGMLNKVITYREFVSPISIYLPNWFKYSLPDGLWAYSFSASLLLCWKDHIKIGKIFFLIPFFCSIVLELFQGLKFFPGTFDLVDLMFSGLGLKLSYIILSILKKINL